jgi:hypothetical protein
MLSHLCRLLVLRPEEGEFFGWASRGGIAMDLMGKIAAQLSGQVLDAYKHKTELNHKRYLAELEHAARAADREHQATESALRREFERSEASKDREHEIRRLWEQARVELWVSAEKDARQARRAVRPFALPRDDLAAMLRVLSREGSFPLLLFASFSDELRSARESDSGPQRYRFGPRSNWAASPWSDDAEPLDGLFSRPLYRGDLDVYMVREELRDLPVVLVNGHIQAGARLWLTLCAWGIFPEDACIRVQFPYLALPVEAATPKSPVEAELELEDQVFSLFAPVAAQLFDWFHLARDGRTPRLHRTLPPGLESQRAIVAAGSLSGFLIAEHNGVLSHLRAIIGTARVAVEGGLKQLASDMIADIRLELQSHPEAISDDTAVGLAALGGAARASRDLDLTAIIYQLLEEVATQLLHDLPGGVL